MEQAVLSEKIERTHILQPSIIGGDRQEKCIGEKIWLVVIKLLQPLFFGRLKKFRITKAKDIAQAYINLANSTSKKNNNNISKYQVTCKIITYSKNTL